MHSDSITQLVKEGVTSFQVLLLKYKSSIGVISEREIEPLALYFEQGSWKLIAYCRLRKEQRTFLVERIHSLEKTDHYFPPNQFSLSDYFKNL